jgi:hypothetical protein
MQSLYKPIQAMVMVALMSSEFGYEVALSLEYNMRHLLWGQFSVKIFLAENILKVDKGSFWVVWDTKSAEQGLHDHLGGHHCTEQIRDPLNSGYIFSKFSGSFDIFLNSKNWSFSMLQKTI